MHVKNYSSDAKNILHQIVRSGVNADALRIKWQFSRYCWTAVLGLCTCTFHYYSAWFSFSNRKKYFFLDVRE